MSEEENPGVEAEASQAIPEPDSTVNAEEKQKAQAFAQKSDDQERNWKEARRKMQELEKKAREQEEVIQRLTTPRPVDDELDKLGDEDIVTKAQARKLAAKMAEEIAQKVIKERENATVEDRLQLKYNDFNQVVSKDNIELLKETEPELAMSLAQNSDPYLQGVAAYKLLKKLGIGAEATPPPESREKKKAIENSQKPLSVNAVTKQSAIGNAHLFENGLTKELKNSLWKEMQSAMKGA